MSSVDALIRSAPGGVSAGVSVSLKLAMAMLMSVGGCAVFAPEPMSPETTVRTFAVALSGKDYESAYALMSDSYRKRVSYEQFKHQAEGNPDEMMRTCQALTSVLGPAAQEAVITYGDRQHLRLVREGDNWRIATNVVDFYNQSTPRNALRTFVRSMERHRYDVVMRLVPEADKDGVTPDRMREAWRGKGREEVERMLSNLKSSLDNPIEVVGNRATMPYGDRLSVQFVRENGVWKIEDPE